MRLRQPVSAATAALLAFTLLACSDSKSSTQTTTSTSSTATVPAAAPSPSPSEGALSRSEEAKRDLVAYYGTIDRVFQSGGKLKPQLADVAIAGDLALLNQEADALRKNGRRQQGGIKVVRLKVLTVTAQKGALPSALLEVCTDTRSRKLLDKSGRNLIPASSPRFFTSTYTLVERTPRRWLVASSETLSQGTSCS